MFLLYYFILHVDLFKYAIGSSIKYILGTTFSSVDYIPKHEAI